MGSTLKGGVRARRPRIIRTCFALIIALALLGNTLANASAGGRRGKKARSRNQAESPERSCRGVAISPLDDVQSRLDAGGGNTSFCFAPGRYGLEAPLVPREGQTLTGRGKAVLTAAQDGIEAFDPVSKEVTIQGFVIEGFTTDSRRGAIDLRSSGAYGWVIRNNEVRHNSGIGICAESLARVVRNHVHHNGRMGLCGSGNDILIKGNEIAYNNTEGYNAYGVAGGTKFVYTRRLVVQNNYSHHNDGPGLWTDLNNVDTLYEGNRVVSNGRAGIFHEASCAAIIRKNKARANGRGVASWLDGAGIQVASSPNVRIFSNIVRNNNHGILLFSEERLDVPRDNCPMYRTVNSRVRRNVVVMGDKVVGRGAPRDAIGLTGMTRGTTEATNKFEGNEYRFVPVGESHFVISDQTLNFAQWQRSGHDKRGKVVAPRSRN